MASLERPYEGKLFSLTKFCRAAGGTIFTDFTPCRCKLERHNYIKLFEFYVILLQRTLLVLNDRTASVSHSMLTLALT